MMQIYIFTDILTVKMSCLEKKKIYINPGSLGCPFDSDFACSGVLEINDNKTIYTSVDIEYDVVTVIKEIQEKNYSMCEKIIDIFFGGRRM